ncbi:hypothetical protein CCOS01_09219 [Colletotrichum costaricense]|uniref:Uncharacterized protein n=1 Tax=Colletotrichum costaricense TaxID=1209916 RepID=A0AAI9YUC8_9PEZI|nr:hypothetical protein CCOS01_09219 [Colletotrichum costaricense]
MPIGRASTSMRRRGRHDSLLTFLPQ